VQKLAAPIISLPFGSTVMPSVSTKVSVRIEPGYGVDGLMRGLVKALEMKEGLERRKEKADGRKRKERKERVEGVDALEEPSTSTSISRNVTPVHRARSVPQACGVVGARRHTLSPHPIGVCTSHSGGAPALPLWVIFMEARCPPSSSQAE
jgi:hypothetical protein